MITRRGFLKAAFGGAAAVVAAPMVAKVTEQTPEYLKSATKWVAPEAEYQLMNTAEYYYRWMPYEAVAAAEAAGWEKSQFTWEATYGGGMHMMKIPMGYLG